MPFISLLNSALKQLGWIYLPQLSMPPDCESVSSKFSVERANCIRRNLEKSTVPPSTKIVFQAGSFFDYHIAEEADKYDLCYDYT
jgi:hypothetical protein